MAYTKLTPQNDVTKLNQTNVAHLDDGIYEAHVTADAAIPAPASPSDDMALIYDTTSGLWTAARVPEAAFASGKIFAPDKIKQDGASIGQALVWDGSDWSPGSIQGVPTGALFQWPATSAPSGYLLCDGTAVSRATYDDLYALIADTYGVGDGSTTFNLPDMRGRVPVGKGTHADVDALGENDGSAVADRRPKHKHTVGGGTGVTAPDPLTGTTGGRSAYSQQAVTVGPQDAGTPTDTPSYLVVNFIIKT